MRSCCNPVGNRRRIHVDSETVFVFVVRGTLRLTVDGQQVPPRKADCYTSRRAPHTPGRTRREESEVLWSIVPPIPRADAR